MVSQIYFIHVLESSKLYESSVYISTTKKTGSQILRPISYYGFYQLKHFLIAKIKSHIIIVYWYNNRRDIVNQSYKNCIVHLSIYFWNH